MADAAHTPSRLPTPVPTDDVDETDVDEPSEDDVSILSLSPREPGESITLENVTERDLREHEFAVAELISTRQRQHNSGVGTTAADLREFLKEEKTRANCEAGPGEHGRIKMTLDPADVLALVVAHVQTMESYQSRGNDDSAESHQAYARTIMDSLEEQAPVALHYLMQHVPENESDVLAA